MMSENKDEPSPEETAKDIRRLQLSPDTLRLISRFLSNPEVVDILDDTLIEAIISRFQAKAIIPRAIVKELILNTAMLRQQMAFKTATAAQEKKPTDPSSDSQSSERKSLFSASHFKETLASISDHEERALTKTILHELNHIVADFPSHLDNQTIVAIEDELRTIETRIYPLSLTIKESVQKKLKQARNMFESHLVERTIQALDRLVERLEEAQQGNLLNHEEIVKAEQLLERATFRHILFTEKGRTLESVLLTLQKDPTWLQESKENSHLVDKMHAFMTIASTRAEDAQLQPLALLLKSDDPTLLESIQQMIQQLPDDKIHRAVLYAAKALSRESNSRKFFFLHKIQELLAQRKIETFNPHNVIYKLQIQESSLSPEENRLLEEFLQ